MSRSSRLGFSGCCRGAITFLTQHGIDAPWFERLRERGRAHHITEVTTVAIGVTAGNERIAARYSEDEGAKERLDSLGELAQ
jgi:hypothetical protein